MATNGSTYLKNSEDTADPDPPLVMKVYIKEIYETNMIMNNNKCIFKKRLSNSFFYMSKRKNF